MKMPGFFAELSLNQTSGYYPFVEEQIQNSGGQGVISQVSFGTAFTRFRWCRGCWICDPYSGFCSCYYPCPVTHL